MSDDPIAADADIAARYLAALLARHVPNTDAVTMTNSYMMNRAMMAGTRADAVRGRSSPPPLKS